MAVISSERGRFVKKGSLEPVMICDRSGFWFSKSDICAEMQWRGDDLVPTGFLVGKPWLNVPNEQNRTPKVSNDPKPVLNARPLNNGDKMGYDAPSTVTTLDILNNFNYTKPPIFNDGLPNSASNPPLENIGGPDVSNVNADERLAMLHTIIQEN